MNKFSVKTDIFFGEGALNRLSQVSGKRVLIVCDEFILTSGIVEQIKEKMPDCEFCIFSKVVPDPPLAVVAEGIFVLKEYRAEVIVAVGGGSSIDAAKAIREMAKSRQGGGINIEECFAIPTTSGTGSEVTQFSVITNPEEGVKYPLVKQSLIPAVAILDPKLTVTVPQTITADTGMDVLTHAVEAYISKDANDFTDAMAEKAVSMVFEYLPVVYRRGDDFNARERMQNASCLAGMAFNGAGLGIVHSLAHAIGGKFHVSHGRSNAIILASVVSFNGYEKGAAHKLCRLARIIGLPAPNGVIGVRNFVNAIRDLQKSLDIPGTLVCQGIAAAAVMNQKDEIIRSAMEDVCTKTNPRSVTVKDLECLLAEITG